MVQPETYTPNGGLSLEYELSLPHTNQTPLSISWGINLLKTSVFPLPVTLWRRPKCLHQLWRNQKVSIFSNTTSFMCLCQGNLPCCLQMMALFQGEIQQYFIGNDTSVEFHSKHAKPNDCLSSDKNIINKWHCTVKVINVKTRKFLCIEFLLLSK